MYAQYLFSVCIYIPQITPVNSHNLARLPVPGAAQMRLPLGSGLGDPFTGHCHVGRNIWQIWMNPFWCFPYKWFQNIAMLQWKSVNFVISICAFIHCSGIPVVSTTITAPSPDDLPPRPWPQVVAKLDATGQAVWCVFWNTLVLGCFGCRISCRSWGNFGSCWWWGGRRNKTCKLEKFSVERSCWFSLPLALDVEELLDVTDQIRQQLVAEDHWEAQARTGQDWMTWRQGETANRAPGTRGSCRSGTSSAEVACYGHGRGGVSLERAWHWGYRGWIVFVEVRQWKKKKIKVVVLSRWRESCQLQLGNKCNII